MNTGIMMITKWLGKVVLMGFIATLFGCGAGEERFVFEKDFQKNLANQVAMVPQTLSQLRQHNVSEQTELKLEYFFYTDTDDKAAALASVLSKKGYTAEHGPSAGDKKLFILTGWTGPMLMNEATVVEWTRQMCRIGFEHDCEFDGWGTNPEQN